jgi:transcriptional regulator with XRE-family HTH domain
MDSTTTEGRSLLERVRLSIPERRVAIDVSGNELARASGVSLTSIYRVENGGCASPALVIRVSTALRELELHAPPKPAPEPLDEGLAKLVSLFDVEGVWAP